MYMSKLHTSRIVSIAASSMVATLGVAFLAYAATTISTNITTAGTLNADGASTLNDAVTLGDAIGDAVTFTGNATSSNNLYVTSAFTVGGNATVTSAGALSIIGALDANGATTLDGAVTLGDAIGDAVTFTGNSTSSNSLYVTGILTVGGNATVTSAGVFSIEGNVTLGDDAASDTVTFNSSLGGHVVTASSTFVAALNNSGPFNSSSTVNVDGATTLNGAVTLGDAIGDDVTITGNATTSNSLFVTGTASTTKLSVGGGAVFTILVGGYCTIVTTTVTASSSAGVSCTGATGVQTTDRIFVMATGSLLSQFQVIAASSTANGAINLMILNHGYTVTTATGINSFNWWAFR